MHISRLFDTLRARLLISFILVVVVTLLATFFALLVFIWVREAGTDQTARQLAEAIVYIQDQVSLNISGNALAPRQEIQLRRLAGQRLLRKARYRILVVDSDRRVIFDSTGTLNGQILPFASDQPYTPPSDLGLPANTKLSKGELRGADGTIYNYMVSPISSTHALVVGVIAPNQLTFARVLENLGDDLLNPLAQAGVVGLLVAVTGAFVITRSVVRPLQAVAESASLVAAGNLEERATVRGPQEVRTVAEAFNHMAAEVQSTQQAQRDFLANVTHDLRTPLTSIQGFSQAIMDGVASNPQSAIRAAQIINDEAGRLNRMVTELLDLAKIEAGRFSMARHALQLSELVGAVGERLTPKAMAKGLTITADLPTLPLIAGDGDRLVQVFTNLVDNAISHTSSGGTITLTAGVKDNGVSVRIRDTGTGIPAEDLPHVFDRFYQVDKSRGQKQGSGLGLTITKQIVEAHKGKITVESVEGLGTAFTVWFPAQITNVTKTTPRTTPPPAKRGKVS